MKVRNILNDVEAPLESHSDKRGSITDVFYQGGVDHVAVVKSKKGAHRGDHYHKETTQHILITQGTMEYYYAPFNNPGAVKCIKVGPGDMITTPPYEIHTLRFPTDNEFMVFSTGKRGGKDYESDTFRVSPILDDHPQRLHLGCGSKFLRGFTHIDLSNYDHIDYQHRIDRLPMIGDNIIETIYCSNAFEYFDREEAVGVLREWRRVLKVGGTLRISVPNFEAICQVYMEHRDADQRGVLGPIFGRWDVGENNIIYHKTVYDLTSLTRLLKAAGFNRIRTWDPHTVLPKDFDDFSKAYMPHMDETGTLMSLNVEAFK
jgi:predicted SAM-dependent methyltransferase